MGLKNAGFDVKIAIDNIEDCKKTHSHNLKNAKFICDDVQNINGSELIRSENINPGGINLVAGGPPCQGIFNSKWEIKIL